MKEKLSTSEIQFISEPKLYFEGRPDEQYKMFFKDPCGNNVEMKAMAKEGDWFIKY